MRFLVAVLLASSLIAQRQLVVRDADPVFDVDPVAIESGGFAAGDLDGDGDVDIATPSGLWLCNGGGFFEPMRLPAPPVIGTVAVLDVDGDGDLDVWQSAWLGAGPYGWLLLNDGTGGFVDATGAAVVGTPSLATDTEVVDVDGDRDPDLVLAHQDGLMLFENRNGVLHDVTGTRLPVLLGSTTVGCLDADGDGDVDLVTWSGELLANDGSGTFSIAPSSGLVGTAATWHPFGDVLVGDLDADGDPDVVIADVVHRNSGGSFAAGSALPVVARSQKALALADLDGDGHLDLVLGGLGPASGADESAAWLHNDGRGGFGSRLPVELPTAEMQSVTALTMDVEGDRDRDVLLFGTWPQWGRVRLLVNDGAGRFANASPVRFPRASDAARGVWADLDGDGDLDVADGPRFLQNDGRGVFSIAPNRFPGYPLSGTPQASGDVDGDGDLDLVAWGRAPIQVIELWLNVGSGYFVDGTAGRLAAQRTPAVPGAALLADIDADGDLDLLVGEGTSWGAPTADRLFRNDGRGYFTFDPTGVASAGSQTRAFAVADVDGDGDRDVVRAGRPCGLLLNDGLGSLADATGLPRVDAETVTVGDVDADGDVDLLVDATLLVNDGAAAFRDETAARLPGLPSQQYAVLADFDQDGALDVLTPDSFWQNDGRGMFRNVTAGRFGVPLADLRYSRLAAHDLDDDADVDVVISRALSDWGLVVVNRHRQVVSPAVPGPGGSLTLTVHSRPGYAPTVALAIPLLAPTAGRTVIPGIGVLGLRPGTIAAAAPILVPAPVGEAQLRIPVPASSSLRDTSVFSQLLLSTTRGLRLSNTVADTIR